MAKLYDQNSEMKNLGLTVESKSKGAGKFGAYDANISKMPRAGYNKYSPTVLPPDKKVRVDAYHLSRGKTK
jgi:hypothetical protein